MKHTHYVLHGYNELNDEGFPNRFVTLDVLADSEAKAKKVAASLSTKKEFMIVSVFQHDPALEEV